MFKDYYKGKRVLVTGHTGFKGGWLSLWLHRLGAKVWGVGLGPPSDPNFHEVITPNVFAGQIECDIRNVGAVEEALKKVKPEIVFHLAAQAIVRRSYVDPLETLQSNVVGTAHVLEAVRKAELPCNVIIITSDKCYENREWEFAYRENDPLGGHDVYSMSKAAAELVAQAWRRSFFDANSTLGMVATVRAGNVIGGGDYAADRIVPDSVRALIAGMPILVRNPNAVRPWQHVLECLSGYLWLGARLGSESKPSRLATAFNFGPDPAARQPVRRLVQEILRHWPGQWNDISFPKSQHEASLLTLSIDKSAAMLDWHPVWEFPDAVKRTMDWYVERHRKRTENLLEFSALQIQTYEQDANSGGLSWASS